MGPEAFGLMVVNQHIAFVETSGHSEGQFLILDRTGVDHAGLGERSKGHHERRIPDHVIDYFVPVEDFDGLGLGLTGKDHADHLIVGVHKIGSVDTDTCRRQQRRDPVFGWTTREDVGLRNDGVVQ